MVINNSPFFFLFLFYLLLVVKILFCFRFVVENLLKNNHILLHHSVSKTPRYNLNIFLLYGLLSPLVVLSFLIDLYRINYNFGKDSNSTAKVHQFKVLSCLSVYLSSLLFKNSTAHFCAIASFLEPIVLNRTCLA